MSDKAVPRAVELLEVLVGEQLVQSRMGHAVHLEIGQEVEVTIETAFLVRGASELWSGEPLTMEAAGALLPFNHGAVTSAGVASDGTLRLGFGHMAIAVPPHAEYEAWNVRGPQNFLIVCLPGGDIAIWS